MLGGRAAVCHANVGRKDNLRNNSCEDIEAIDLAIMPSESGGKEKAEGKIEDPDYDEEQDRLYLFPPLRYRKGDVSFGVLMSG